MDRRPETFFQRVNADGPTSAFSAKCSALQIVRKCKSKTTNYMPTLTPVRMPTSVLFYWLQEVMETL